MGSENCADGCGRRGCNGVAGRGEAAGDEQAWLRGRLRTGHGCGELRGRLRTVCEMGGEKKPLGMSEIERAWLRGRLRRGNGFGELRGRLRTAWVQRSGWKGGRW